MRKIYLPLIFFLINRAFRGDTKYFCVRILDQLVLCNYPADFPDEVKQFGALLSQPCDKCDVVTLNEINSFHVNYLYGRVPFQDTDNLVKYDDFMKFYSLLKSCSNKNRQQMNSSSTTIIANETSKNQINNNKQIVIAPPANTQALQYQQQHQQQNRVINNCNQNITNTKVIYTVQENNSIVNRIAENLRAQSPIIINQQANANVIQIIKRPLNDVIQQQQNQKIRQINDFNQPNETLRQSLAVNNNLVHHHHHHHGPPQVYINAPAAPEQQMFSVLNNKNCNNTPVLMNQLGQSVPVQYYSHQQPTPQFVNQQYFYQAHQYQPQQQQQQHQYIRHQQHFYQQQHQQMNQFNMYIPPLSVQSPVQLQINSNNLNVVPVPLATNRIITPPIGNSPNLVNLIEASNQDQQICVDTHTATCSSDVSHENNKETTTNEIVDKNDNDVVVETGNISYENISLSPLPSLVETEVQEKESSLEAPKQAIDEPKAVTAESKLEEAQKNDCSKADTPQQVNDTNIADDDVIIVKELITSFNGGWLQLNDNILPYIDINEKIYKFTDRFVQSKKYVPLEVIREKNILLTESNLTSIIIASEKHLEFLNNLIDNMKDENKSKTIVKYEKLVNILEVIYEAQKSNFLKKLPKDSPKDRVFKNYVKVMSLSGGLLILNKNIIPFVVLQKKTLVPFGCMKLHLGLYSMTKDELRYPVPSSEMEGLCEFYEMLVFYVGLEQSIKPNTVLLDITPICAKYPNDFKVLCEFTKEFPVDWKNSIKKFISKLKPLTSNSSNICESMQSMIKTSPQLENKTSNIITNESVKKIQQPSFGSCSNTIEQSGNTAKQNVQNSVIDSSETRRLLSKDSPASATTTSQNSNKTIRNVILNSKTALTVDKNSVACSENPNKQASKSTNLSKLISNLVANELNSERNSLKTVTESSSNVSLETSDGPSSSKKSAFVYKPVVNMARHEPLPTIATCVSLDKAALIEKSAISLKQSEIDKSKIKNVVEASLNPNSVINKQVIQNNSQQTSSIKKPSSEPLKSLDGQSITKSSFKSTELNSLKNHKEPINLNLETSSITPAPITKSSLNDKQVTQTQQPLPIVSVTHNEKPSIGQSKSSDNQSNPKLMLNLISTDLNSERSHLKNAIEQSSKECSTKVPSTVKSTSVDKQKSQQQPHARAIQSVNKESVHQEASVSKVNPTNQRENSNNSKKKDSASISPDTAGSNEKKQSSGENKVLKEETEPKNKDINIDDNESGETLCRRLKVEPEKEANSLVNNKADELVATPNINTEDKNDTNSNNEEFHTTICEIVKQRYRKINKNSSTENENPMKITSSSVSMSSIYSDISESSENSADKNTVLKSMNNNNLKVKQNGSKTNLKRKKNQFDNQDFDFVNSVGRSSSNSSVSTISSETHKSIGNTNKIVKRKRFSTDSDNISTKGSTDSNGNISTRYFNEFDSDTESLTYNLRQRNEKMKKKHKLNPFFNFTDKAYFSQIKSLENLDVYTSEEFNESEKKTTFDAEFYLRKFNIKKCQVLVKKLKV